MIAGRYTYGFDLSPIAQRHDEFLALAERAAAEERERAALRRRLTIARKAIRQVAECALEHGLTGRDWRSWLAEVEGRALTLPTELALAALREAVVALEERRKEGEAALREAFDSVQNAPSGAPECTPITTTTQPQADKSATRRADCQATDSFTR
jgi:chromosome segregation ATPase